MVVGLVVGPVVGPVVGRRPGAVVGLVVGLSDMCRNCLVRSTARVRSINKTETAIYIGGRAVTLNRHSVPCCQQELAGSDAGSSGFRESADARNLHFLMEKC